MAFRKTPRYDWRVMSLSPDFYVIASGSPGAIQLVVEARLTNQLNASGEKQLKRYMLGMDCPVGLLVTPEKFWVYRDTYTNRTESSIERRGPFRVPVDSEIVRVAKNGNPIDFEHAVRAWLERLARTRSLKGFSADAVDAFDTLILPALASGEIRSSGPVLNHE
jgi:hypothetical protein